ncbi:MAG: hypothetical protein HFE54_06135, partial [Turicibacter sp.]|nr:hypothetical protein [Turicibacter sp.]
LVYRIGSYFCIRVIITCLPLNEGSILKSIRDYHQEKTIILVSHRQSTTAICDQVYQLKDRKLEMSS